MSAKEKKTNKKFDFSQKVKSITRLLVLPGFKTALIFMTRSNIHPKVCSKQSASKLNSPTLFLYVIQLKFHGCFRGFFNVCLFCFPFTDYSTGAWIAFSTIWIAAWTKRTGRSSRTRFTVPGSCTSSSAGINRSSEVSAGC